MRDFVEAVLYIVVLSFICTYGALWLLAVAENLYLERCRRSAGQTGLPEHSSGGNSISK